MDITSPAKQINVSPPSFYQSTHDSQTPNRQQFNPSAQRRGPGSSTSMSLRTTFNVGAQMKYGGNEFIAGGMNQTFNGKIMGSPFKNQFQNNQDTVSRFNQTTTGFNTNSALTQKYPNMNLMGRKAVLNTTCMNLPELNTLSQLDQFKGQTYERSGMNTVLGNYNTDKKTPSGRNNLRPSMMAAIQEGVPVKHNNLMQTSTRNDQNPNLTMDGTPSKVETSQMRSPSNKNATDLKVSSHHASVPSSPRTAQNKNKRRYQSLPRSSYKLTVNETVIAGSKKLNIQHGIPGYEVPRRGDRGEFWHHDTTRPVVFGIHKEKVKGPKHYLDDAMRMQMGFPGPNKYNMAKDLKVSYNIMTTKSPRVTEALEIEQRAKKNKFPDPSSYKPDFKSTDPKILGCLKSKEDRSNEFDQASVIGKESAPYPPNEKNFSEVDVKLRYAKIYKASPTKPLEKSNLSPNSYNATDSYKSTQLPAPRFYISKYKHLTFLDHNEKKTKWTPGSGTYKQDIPSCMTKGLAKGWK